MIRFLLRAFGTVLLAAGVAALVVDGVRSVEASRPLVTSVDQWLTGLGWAAVQVPAGLVGGRVLDLGLAAASRFLPLWGVLAMAGLLLLAAGRPRAAGIGTARR